MWSLVHAHATYCLHNVTPAGEIVVFNIDGRDIPIVHRVIKVRQTPLLGQLNTFGCMHVVHIHARYRLRARGRMRAHGGSICKHLATTLRAQERHMSIEGCMGSHGEACHLGRVSTQVDVGHRHSHGSKLSPPP